MKNVWVFFLSIFSALTAMGQTSVTEKEKMLILDKRDLFFPMMCPLLIISLTTDTSMKRCFPLRWRIKNGKQIR